MILPPNILPVYNCVSGTSQAVYYNIPEGIFFPTNLSSHCNDCSKLKYLRDSCDKEAYYF